MKRLLLSAAVLALAFAQMVRADNNDSNNNRKTRKRPVPTTAAQPAAQNRQPVQRTAPQVYRNYQTSNVRSTPRYSARPTTANPSFAFNRNFDHGNAASIQRSYPHRSFDRNSFTVARTRVVRTYHDRNWWRYHYAHNRFVLFGGGYYYFNSGYWYPAYGYSPIYNTYAYNEPIYGYNDLAPGQVLENVQLALRDQGYYSGAIDGLVGPETRDALAAYQRDNNLVVTAAVDEPTLVTLGLA